LTGDNRPISEKCVILCLGGNYEKKVDPIATQGYSIPMGRLFDNRLMRKIIVSAAVAIMPEIFSGGVFDFPPGSHEKIPGTICTISEPNQIGVIGDIGFVSGTDRPFRLS
jgi:hypothetical protein